MDKPIKEELVIQLKQIRAERKPSNRGIMLLTAFLGSVMLSGSNLKDEEQDTLEFLFWVTHNGDGTPITPEHRSA
jgi:hypothetical protein